LWTGNTRQYTGGQSCALTVNFTANSNGPESERQKFDRIYYEKIIAKFHVTDRED